MKPHAGRHCTFLNDSKPENAIPGHQQINFIAGHPCPYYNVSYLEKAIFDSFEDCKRDFWESAYRPNSRIKQPICESFQSSKHDSWVSANRSPFTTALTISDCFAAWELDSWTSANLPHCWTALLIFQRFAPWNHYSWTSAKRLSCRMVLKISEIFQTWKCHDWLSKNRHPCSSTQSISERFAAWKQIVNISRTTIFQERFEAWKRDSWNHQIYQIARRVYSYVNVSKSPNKIPEYQQIEVLYGRHCPYLKNFATWICVSWASKKKILCAKALHISERFAA